MSQRDDSLFAEPSDSEADTLERALRDHAPSPLSPTLESGSLPAAQHTLERALDGRFKLVRKLGQGGMGAVYEAEDLANGARVALKTMVGQSPQRLYRFKKEFRALRDAAHPNLIALGELIEAEGVWCFTMELIEGRDLAAYIAPDTVGEGLFDEGRLRAALGQLGLGLSALHGAGLVHRDIKPSNIMVTDGGRVVLLDFGLITDADNIDRSTGSGVVGTVAYMSPEQAASGVVGAASDWYSVGVILFQALTGQLPHTGPPLQVLMDKQTRQPPPPRTLAPRVPADLDALCVSLLDFDPARRPDGAALGAMLGAGGAPPTAPGAPPVVLSPSSSTSHGGAGFVGRARELARLDEAYERSQRGAGVSVVIVGESGLGKSQLARHFARSRGMVGAVRLSGRCLERESVPFKALDGVVDALSRFMNGLPAAEAAALVPRGALFLSRLFPVLEGVPAIRDAPRPKGDGVAPIEIRRRAFAALRELFARLGERHPVVIVIDDLQWADKDSLFLLGELLASPNEPSALWLITSRPFDGFEDVLRQIGLGQEEVLDLGPLSDGDAGQLARRLLDRAGIDGDAEAIVKEAGGHPLFVAELVRFAALRDVGEWGQRPALDEALLARVESLDEGPRALLEAVCLAGGPLMPGVACEAQSLAPSSFAREFSFLRIGHLLRESTSEGQIEPYHDRVREVVAGQLGQDRRAHLHRALALAIERSPMADAQPHLLLEHFEAAGEAARAGRHALDAARKASVSLAFERAAQLFADALRLGDLTPEARLDLKIELADAFAQAGHTTRSAEMFLEAATETEGREARNARRSRAAGLFLLSGDLERGDVLLKEVCVALGLSHPRSKWSLIAGLFVMRARIAVRMRRLDPARPLEHQRVSDEARSRFELCFVAGGSYGHTDTSKMAYFSSQALLLALESGDADHIALSLTLESSSAIVRSIHNGARSREILAMVRQRFESSSNWMVEGQYHFAWGMLLHHECKPSEALDSFERCLRLLDKATATEKLNTGATARIFRLFCLFHMSDFARLRLECMAFLRDAERRQDRLSLATLSRALHKSWLIDDDLEEARRRLAAVHWPLPERGYHQQQFWEAKALSEQSLYEGSVAHWWPRLDQHLRAFERSMLWRVSQFSRIDGLWLRGSLLLALSRDAPAHLAGVRRQIRLLEKERGHPKAAVLAAVLRAGAVLVEQGAPAAALLEELIVHGRESGHKAVSIAVQRRLGELLGGARGEALFAEADAAWRAQGIVRPDRFARLYLPEVHAPSRSLTDSG